MTTDFECILAKDSTWSRAGAWYKTQKEHWLGWLAEYRGPGYYGRKNSHRSAEFVYNHIVCPPMVLWLAEASGIPKPMVAKAAQAALSARSTLAARCNKTDYCLADDRGSDWQARNGTTKDQINAN